MVHKDIVIHYFKTVVS